MTSTPFLRGCVAALLVFVATTTHAAAPFSKVPVPGFYRIMVGDFEVTALSDGTVSLPMDTLLTNVTPEAVQQALAKNFVQTPVEVSVNAYLVNTGKKLVLIDAGAGTLFGPTLAKLPANLRAAGYRTDQIDEIYITHMHGDHIGGLMSGEKRTFPNAIVRADKHDADFWLSKENLDNAPAEAKGSFQGAIASLDPYIKAGKFMPFEGSTDLVPGVKAVASHGHTPGHITYVLESQGQKMVFWGDLMHVAAVQFENPSVTIQFDSDAKTAAEQRKLAYADAAKNGYLVGVAHVSFPGIGRLRAEGPGYVWLPVSYSTLSTPAK